jgi:hypothetical protein
MKYIGGFGAFLMKQIKAFPEQFARERVATFGKSAPWKLPRTI